MAAALAPPWRAFRSPLRTFRNPLRALEKSSTLSLISQRIQGHRVLYTRCISQDVEKRDGCGQFRSSEKPVLAAAMRGEKG